MDRSIGGSRFHCGCARCFSGPRRTRNWTTSCRTTSNEKPRNTSRCSVGGRSPICVFNPWSHSILRAKIRWRRPSLPQQSRDIFMVEHAQCR